MQVEYIQNLAVSRWNVSYGSLTRVNQIQGNTYLDCAPNVPTIPPPWMRPTNVERMFPVTDNERDTPSVGQYTMFNGLQMTMVNAVFEFDIWVVAHTADADDADGYVPLAGAHWRFDVSGTVNDAGRYVPDTQNAITGDDTFQVYSRYTIPVMLTAPPNFSNAANPQRWR